MGREEIVVRPAGAAPPLRTAHVLFVDIVEFTKDTFLVDQLDAINELERLALACSEVECRERTVEYLAMPTGDGFALAFLDSPDAALLTGLELARGLAATSIRCRMGVHTGTVCLREDINAQRNLVGGGMNLAQRVMSFADAGHILASAVVKESLCQVSPEYESLFHYLGHYSAKHDVILELYNVFDHQVGNPDPPARRRVTGGNRRLWGPDDPLIAPHMDREILGRRKEIGRVLAFLASDERLAVVTGAPGVGKTEVCRAALREWLAGEPDSVAYYAGLTGADELSEFVTRLADAYGAPGVAGLEQLLAVAAGNPGLLYLDNLEGLLTDVDAVELLKGLLIVPGLRAMASSRRLLEGIGWDVHIDRVKVKPATDLFRSEWRKAGGKMKDSPDLREFLTDQLGCHPLSIVLVAAQAPFYPTLDNLRAAWQAEGTRVARLRVGMRDKLTDLDKSISFSLASLKKQPECEGSMLLWGLMIFFPDGMSDSAWQFFEENSGINRDSLNVLVRLSLASHGTITMLPPLQRFAEERAVSQEEGFDLDTLIDSAYPYFLSVAREAQKHEFDKRRGETLDALLREFANVHRFMTVLCLHCHAQVDRGSLLSRCLSNSYQYRALASADTLERLLPLQRNASLAESVAHTLLHLGRLKQLLGSIDDAQSHYQEAIQLYRQERDNLGLANALLSLGDLESRLGQIDDAQSHYQEAIQLYPQERGNLGLANALRSLGDLESHLGHIDDAQSHYQEAIQLYRQERDNLGLANALLSLGDLERGLGHIDDAQSHYQEAIQLYRQERANLGLANALQSQGDLLREQGTLPQAKEVYSQARALYVAEQDNMGLAYTDSELARVCHGLGEHPQRDRFLKEALARARDSNVPGVLEYVDAVRAELAEKD